MEPIDLNTAIQKSVFLLGAGASYGTKKTRTGCKMSGEMFDALQNLLNKPEKNEITDVEAEAFRFLISTLHYQNNWRSLEKNSKFEFKPNIEELALVIRRIKNRENYLPYPITGNWADKLIQLESKFNSENNDADSLFESLENKLKRKLLLSWLQINPDSLSYLEPLAQLMSAQSLESPIECFSLNYDQTIEIFLKNKHEVHPYCGFVSGEWKGPKTKDIEGFDRLNLYKLHGSLDWVRLMDSGTIKIRENLQDEEEKDIDQRHDPYLIFGHGLKTFSFEPFSSLMYHFKESLSKRPYIFAIGYSFFDPYINNLIIEALNYNEFSKLIIVNPVFGPEDIKDDESRVLSEYIEEIQKNTFYSEMPEFNMQKIKGTDRIRYINVGFDTFLSEHFLNNGKGLIDLINEYEIDRGMEENPF
ncbi:SIR2 family protein [Arenibacter sp. F20364]|uniref:SIR2 family protein n=1 Tax=Arenibacter sp. F20364 TaxID=2926415 RepID=UPI001FF2E7B5|nr:SIR2 family protein [Arenibacter sp. F20364]MCK0189672.1 SIR2 family protein [Arenibacter sp. F20364]|tara:strand:- start:330 stop:1580 length:1251 start_codon:yes stop_codon:yes gene_type:complete